MAKHQPAFTNRKCPKKLGQPPVRPKNVALAIGKFHKPAAVFATSLGLARHNIDMRAMDGVL